MEVILREQQASPAPNPETLPIDVARANFIRNNAVWNTPLPPMGSASITLGGVACLDLRPVGCGDDTLVFVHGGGWTFGTPGTHERFARLLAQLTNLRTILPDYRLAPEHPAPAAIDDVLAVMATLPGRVALCGDSAGANIALAAALSRPGQDIAILSLLYGCFAPVFDTDSHHSNGDGRFGLSTMRMRWYWANWQGASADQRSMPLYGDLAEVPPCHLLVAGLDPLRDDSFLMAGRLAAAGVPVRLDIIPGVIHGFLQMTARLAPAMVATRMIATEISTALRRGDNKNEGDTQPWTQLAAPS
jgi:acetyl esterase